MKKIILISFSVMLLAVSCKQDVQPQQQATQIDEETLKAAAFAAVDQATKGVWDKKIEISEFNPDRTAVRGTWVAKDYWDWIAWQQDGNWKILVSSDGFICDDLKTIPSQHADFFKSVTYLPTGQLYCYADPAVPLADDLVSLPTAPPAPESAEDPAAAQNTLTLFFGLLNNADYAGAIMYYGGGYAQLRDWNPGVLPNDKTTLFQNGCEANGLNCLKVKTVQKVEQLAPDKYSFVVQFAKADGSVFEQGPCCGSTSGPIARDFAFEVRKAGNQFFVMNLPVYTP